MLVCYCYCEGELGADDARRWRERRSDAQDHKRHHARQVDLTAWRRLPNFPFPSPFPQCRCGCIYVHIRSGLTYDMRRQHDTKQLFRDAGGGRCDGCINSCESTTQNDCTGLLTLLIRLDSIVRPEIIIIDSCTSASAPSSSYWSPARCTPPYERTQAKEKSVIVYVSEKRENYLLVVRPDLRTAAQNRQRRRMGMGVMGMACLPLLPPLTCDPLALLPASRALVCSSFTASNSGSGTRRYLI